MHTEALRQVAARCRSRLADIADDYAREVTRLPGYEAAAVTDDELYDTAYQVLGLMMQMLAGDGGQARLSAVYAGSVLATTMRPEVPTSSRCTIPTRSGAPEVEIR